MTVQENLVIVNEAIKESCARAGRSLQDIKLVAVTKTVGIEKTNEVIEAGIIDLGEIEMKVSYRNTSISVQKLIGTLLAHYKREK